ncbi:hypothetical protein [Nocardia bhagyanarayanae]|uniref:hypothetical protein n=1 Tax=Nocardia bhagyanarayanae TaxID=1215925 RepID=UPI00114E969E|nr:hypothetical protein [Nocardia bhagyanarayanae]
MIASAGTGTDFFSPSGMSTPPAESTFRGAATVDVPAAFAGATVEVAAVSAEVSPEQPDTATTNSKGTAIQLDFTDRPLFIPCTRQRVGSANETEHDSFSADSTVIRAVFAQLVGKLRVPHA